MAKGKLPPFLQKKGVKKGAPVKKGVVPSKKGAPPFVKKAAPKKVAAKKKSGRPF